MNGQEFTTLDSRGENAEEDSVELGLSLPSVTAFEEFEERLEWLHNLYGVEARFQRQL